AVAAVAGQGPGMLLDSKGIPGLSKTEGDLRDKSLFSAFELPHVKRAGLTDAGKPPVVGRGGTRDLKVVDSTAGPAKQDKVSNLILGLKSLRWKEIVSPKGDDASRYGLDRPALEVSLYKADGGEVATLLVGKEEGGVTFVRMKSAPTIYAVDSQV